MYSAETTPIMEIGTHLPPLDSPSLREARTFSISCGIRYSYCMRGVQTHYIREAQLTTSSNPTYAIDHIRARSNGPNFMLAAASASGANAKEWRVRDCSCSPSFPGPPNTPRDLRSFPAIPPSSFVQTPCRLSLSTPRFPGRDTQARVPVMRSTTNVWRNRGRVCMGCRRGQEATGAGQAV